MNGGISFFILINLVSRMVDPGVRVSTAPEKVTPQRIYKPAPKEVTPQRIYKSGKFYFVINKNKINLSWRNTLKYCKK
ncbi:unnamed protein product [Rhizophagus irregularis]|nr:unnamed protein product [Rhizophagus irregularis]